MSASTMMNNKIQTQGIEEETMMMMMQKKQSIVTILGLGCDDSYSNTDSVPNSLRRTLSADMPSKNWSSPMKKIASSEELFPHNQMKKTIADSSSSSEEEDYEERKELEAEEAEADADAERERLEIWSAIQKNKKEEQEKLSSGGANDTWGSIMSIKGDDNNNILEISKSLPATPYVHPLVKRTKSCSLSLKSLAICTESLGSETGSDGLLFSPFPKPESGESKTEQQQQEKAKASDLLAEGDKWYNNHAAVATRKSSPPRSFPPPLPSLSFQQAKGSSLHMRPHRDNGRLVLEAVSFPSQNNFNAQRQDGRLVLTFANEEENYDDEGVGNEDLEEEFGDFDQEEKEDEYDDESEEEDDDDDESVIKEETLSSSTNVHRMTLMMNNKDDKQIGLVNRNPNWSEKFNKGVNFEDVNVVEKEPATANSLPSRPRVARLIPSPAAQAVASGSGSLNMNAYWRTKPTPPNDQNNKVIVFGANNQTPGGQQQLLVLRGRNGNYLVHNFKNCKDSRRSLLFWEPYCIATS